MLQMKVQKSINYGKSLIGKPYEWWTGGDLSKKDPMWSDNGPVPNNSEVKSLTCAGLMNLILRNLNMQLPYSVEGGVGGTMAYYDYYKDKTETFDINKCYPKGTLIGRKYRDLDDQGHVAIIVENGYVLQSIPEEGVNMSYTVYESHAGYYYEYAVLPEHWIE
jgi:hypothetical protein